MSASLQACEDFTGSACETQYDQALPEDWTEIGAAVGILYRDARGQAYTHQVDGDVLIADGYILIEAPGLELDARGLVGSKEL